MASGEVSQGAVSSTAPEEHICPCPVGATAYSALTHPCSGRRSQRGEEGVDDRVYRWRTLLWEMRGEQGADRCVRNNPARSRLAGSRLPREAAGARSQEVFQARLVGRGLEQHGLLEGPLVHDRGWNEVVLKVPCNEKALGDCVFLSL